MKTTAILMAATVLSLVALVGCDNKGGAGKGEIVVGIVDIQKLADQSGYADKMREQGAKDQGEAQAQVNLLRDTLTKQLRAKISEQFDNRQELRKLEIEDLKKQVEDLNKQLTEMDKQIQNNEKNKDKLIESRARS